MNPRVAVAIGLFLLCAAASAGAHDVPNDVRVQLFVHPESERLRVIVRVPLASMNDVPWPTNGVLLDLSSPELPGAMRDGATDWVLDRIEAFEDDRRLDGGRLAAIRIAPDSDRAFDAYDTALHAVLASTARATEVIRN